MTSPDVGLFVLRVVVGALLVGHGSQKLFGWFGGFGLRGMAAHLETMGYRPGLPFALLAAIAETAGGLLLALGFVTPLAAALLTATMVNAYAAHAGKGVWAQNGGWEYPLVLGVVAVALDLAGPGAWSLDAALGLAPWNGAWIAGGIVAGLAGGVFGLLLWGSRRPVRAEPRHAVRA
ncbi:MAG TPA: DoxX family protein [Thermomicrobiales bacterium]|jgi:putative oxidoreductase|nr:DoxX family protein [Thermomicrobiales bacterium]